MLTGPGFYHWPPRERRDREPARARVAAEKLLVRRRRSVRLTGPGGNIGNLTAHLLLPSIVPLPGSIAVSRSAIARSPSTIVSHSAPLFYKVQLSLAANMPACVLNRLGAFTIAPKSLFPGTASPSYPRGVHLVRRLSRPRASLRQTHTHRLGRDDSHTPGEKPQ